MKRKQSKKKQPASKKLQEPVNCATLPRGQSLSDGLTGDNDNVPARLHSPDSEVALQGLGAAALATLQFSEAAQHFERLVELDPNNYDYWLNLGIARHRLGNQAGAIASYRKALQIRPEGSSAHMNLGLLYQERENATQSAETLGQGPRIGPERADIQYTVNALDDTAGLDQAALICDELLGTNEGMTGGWFRRGEIRLKSGDFSQAAECFEKCVQQRPEWIEAAMNLAVAYGKQGRKDHTERVLKNALAHKPDSVELVRMLAALSLDQQQFDNALRYHLRLVELGDQSAEVRHNLGLLYQTRGDFRRAVAQYQDALSIKPNFAEALVNLGHALNASGRREAAKDAWIRARQLQPELQLGQFPQ